MYLNDYYLLIICHICSNTESSVWKAPNGQGTGISVQTTNCNSTARRWEGRGEEGRRMAEP